MHDENGLEISEQDNEHVRKEKETSQLQKSWEDGLIWFINSLWFI